MMNHKPSGVDANMSNKGDQKLLRVARAVRYPYRSRIHPKRRFVQEQSSGG